MNILPIQKKKLKIFRKENLNVFYLFRVDRWSFLGVIHHCHSAVTCCQPLSGCDSQPCAAPGLSRRLQVPTADWGPQKSL